VMMMIHAVSVIGHIYVPPAGRGSVCIPVIIIVPFFIPYIKMTFSLNLSHVPLSPIHLFDPLVDQIFQTF
jgi:hypothetical protein